MIKIAVFDLDGTLVNSLTDLALSVNKGLRQAGLPEHPIEKYNRFVGNGRAKLIRRAIGEGCTDALYDEVLRVFDADPTPHRTSLAPGTGIRAGGEGIEVACGGGETLLITEVQAPGKKRMSAVDYLRGHPIYCQEV